MGAALCRGAGTVRGCLAGGWPPSWRLRRNRSATGSHGACWPAAHASNPLPAPPSTAAWMLGPANVRDFCRAAWLGLTGCSHPPHPLQRAVPAGKVNARLAAAAAAGRRRHKWVLQPGKAGRWPCGGLPVAGRPSRTGAPRCWIGAWLPGARGCHAGHPPGPVAPPQRRLGGGQRPPASGGSQEPCAGWGEAAAPLHAISVLGACRADQPPVSSSPLACAHQRAPIDPTRGALMQGSIDDRGEGERVVPVGGLASIGS